MQRILVEGVLCRLRDSHARPHNVHAYTCLLLRAALRRRGGRVEGGVLVDPPERRGRREVGVAADAHGALAPHRPRRAEPARTRGPLAQTLKLIHDFVSLIS